MRIATLISAIFLAGAASAAPNTQLVNSVQHNLNLFGFAEVDASTLSTRQIAALHMKLSSNATRFGLNGIRLRQDIKVILGWDAPVVKNN
ncbi:MAG: hypothetical protein AAGA12_04900 [Pseudomonadota bacterium]